MHWRKYDVCINHEKKKRIPYHPAGISYIPTATPLNPFLLFLYFDAYHSSLLCVWLFFQRNAFGSISITTIDLVHLQKVDWCLFNSRLFCHKKTWASIPFIRRVESVIATANKIVHSPNAPTKESMPVYCILRVRFSLRVSEKATGMERKQEISGVEILEQGTGSRFWMGPKQECDGCLSIAASAGSTELCSINGSMD